MNEKNKQKPRIEPQATTPEVYGPYNKADLDRHGYFRIGLDHERMAMTDPEQRARRIRKRIKERDDGYER